MQTVQEKQAVISSFPWPVSLADTLHNADMLGARMAEKYGDDWTLEGLLDVFTELSARLQWLTNAPEKIELVVTHKPAPDSTPATPKLKGDFTDRLLQVGVRPASGISHTDDSEKQKQESKWKTIRDTAELRQRRQALIQRREDAKSFAIYGDNGRIVWSATNQKRSEMLAQVQKAIDEFNARVGNTDLRIN